mmetsp:Transcript_11799/g.16872  ORF Transcript_11799/g.16872 Transcript_11799/m.16872 type:complete len:93 (+) Transcript_11799:305-583(+)
MSFRHQIYCYSREEAMSVTSNRSIKRCREERLDFEDQHRAICTVQYVCFVDEESWKGVVGVCLPGTRVLVAVPVIPGSASLWYLGEYQVPVL